MAKDPFIDYQGARPEERNRRSRATRAALRITVVYLVLGLTWIAVSDYVLKSLVKTTGDPLQLLTWFQTVKGWAYVIATSGLLFAMVRSYIRSIQKADEQARIKSQAVLAQQQAVLEKRVEERTRELSEANEALTKEMQERQEIQEQLRAAKGAAELANEAKSVFLANTSHEIRTPLTSILGFADLLMDGTLAEQERQRYLGVVQQNAAHLLKLIDDLLDLSRVEMGKMSMVAGDYSPKDVAQQAVDLLAPRAAEKNLPLSLEVAGDVPATIKTDGARLRQVLVNLLSNAVKFTEAGRVVLKVNAAADGAGFVRFEVSDTGIGMKADQIGRIFEPFFQIDQGENRRYGGSGLGLAISRQLTEQMGGTIEVTSVPGKGSRFVVQVPRVLAMPAPRMAGPSEEAGALADAIDGHVLLAEDNANIRWLVEEYLRRAGANVTPVANGIEAVDRVTKSLEKGGVNGAAIDLVLMDIHMPGMDGAQAIRRVREAGYKGPIVALTAHSITDAGRWRELGCDAVAGKPIDRKSFIPLLARLIRERRRQ